MPMHASCRHAGLVPSFGPALRNRPAYLAVSAGCQRKLSPTIHMNPQCLSDASPSRSAGRWARRAAVPQGRVLSSPAGPQDRLLDDLTARSPRPDSRDRRPTARRLGILVALVHPMMHRMPINDAPMPTRPVPSSAVLPESKRSFARLREP